MARSQRTNIIKLHYDKIIVVVVLLTLLLSLACLISLSGSQRDNEASFDSKLEALKPDYEKAEPLDSEVFSATLAALEKPYEIGPGSLMIAAERVSCIACGWPIKLEDDICRYCNAQQPTGEVEEGWDSDKDGMPDIWEKQYGLNPLDPLDAAGDMDRDNFTNLEEWIAGTDPTDPKSRPPLIDFLRAEKIDPIRFPYALKSKSSLGGGAYRFQLNEGAARTYFVKIGEEVDKSGYKAVSFTNKLVVVKTPGMADKTKEIVVLKLSNGQDEVELVESGGPVWNRFEVTLICEKERESKPIVVKQRESFTFDSEQYTVVRISKGDGTGKGVVVVRNESTQREITIPGL